MDTSFLRKALSNEAMDLSFLRKGLSDEAKGLSIETKGPPVEAKGLSDEAKGLSNEAMDTSCLRKVLAVETKGLSVEAKGLSWLSLHAPQRTFLLLPARPVARWIRRAIPSTAIANSSASLGKPASPLGSSV